MKKKRKLKRQIIAVTLLSYLVTLIASGYIMYTSSRKTYLSAKNDMIERDLKRISDSLTAYNGLGWFLDYSREHPDEVGEEVTSEELNYDLPSIFDEDDAYAILDNLSPEEQLAFAKDIYSCVVFNMNYERNTFDYGGLMLISLNSDSEAFIFYEADITKDDEVVYEGSRIGDIWHFKSKSHPALKKLLSGKTTSIEYEIAPTKNGTGRDRYIAYLPIVENGEIKALLTLDYDWSDFHDTLVLEVRNTVLILLMVMIVFSIILIFVLNKIAIRPLSNIQSSVREYIETKDSSIMDEHSKKNRSNNEIEILSDDLDTLAHTMDDYIKGIKDLTSEVMEALAGTIDAKDTYTKGHSFRVAKYSTMIAKEMGLSKKERESIKYMGLLHDIGKIGVPDFIINKPSKLTTEEFDIIKKHPAYGYDILSQIKTMPELSTGARWHHERIDGKGYPDGLKGDEIPLAARIIAVADSYDAMTSNRSYRKYLPQKTVREEIVNNTGTQFDPDAAKAMLKIIDEDKDFTLHE